MASNFRTYAARPPEKKHSIIDQSNARSRNCFPKGLDRYIAGDQMWRDEFPFRHTMILHRASRSIEDLGCEEWSKMSTQTAPKGPAQSCHDLCLLGKKIGKTLPIAAKSVICLQNVPQCQLHVHRALSSEARAARLMFHPRLLIRHRCQAQSSLCE